MLNSGGGFVAAGLASHGDEGGFIIFYGEAVRYALVANHELDFVATSVDVLVYELAVAVAVANGLAV